MIHVFIEIETNGTSCILDITFDYLKYAKLFNTLVKSTINKQERMSK